MAKYSAVLSLSGGVSSWAAGRRYIDQFDPEGVVAVFADTGIEDPDTYRFVRESAAQLAVPLVWLGGDKTIWDVFREKRFLGNTRVDLCSRVLKREPLNKWLAENAPDADVVVGIDWSEEFRFTRLRDRGPWKYFAPLCDAPYLTKEDQHQWAESCGLARQRLYRIGAEHANCGGGCVKMGQGGFARMLARDPERYAEWEREENKLRDQLGEVAILRDRTGGEVRPLPLWILRERIESQGVLDLEEQSPCGCFVGPVDDLTTLTGGTDG